MDFRHQRRRNLALRLTPKGVVVLMPHGLDPDSERVRWFVEDALARLPERQPDVPGLTLDQVQQMVADWSVRLDVRVTRLQVRSMRNKWGSLSTAGNLTLASELLALPSDLVEYVVVHELLHLKFPDHRQGWQVGMGMYLPDWRERERRLAAYVLEQ